MVHNAKLMKFLYNFESRFLFYIPVRGMFDHLSIVMQPILEPGSPAALLWSEVEEGHIGSSAVCVELLTRPEYQGADLMQYAASWAPHIKLVNWDPRDAPVTTSTYAWNFAMILLGTHKFSKNFGSYSALWKDCQTFVRYIVPHFQGERAKGGLEGKRIETREELDEFLRSEGCTLDTINTGWARQDTEGGLPSTSYFCYVSLSPALRPDLFLTAVKPSKSSGPAPALRLAAQSDEARPCQQFYLDYSIGTGHCTLTNGPGELVGVQAYQVGAPAVCGAGTVASKFLSRAVQTLDGGTSRLRLHLVFSSKKGSAATHSVDSSLVLTYSEASGAVEYRKVEPGDAQTWIMTERSSTQMPACPAALLFDGRRYQLSAASEPDCVLTHHKSHPLLGVRNDAIKTQQTVVLHFKPDVNAWLITAEESEYALDVKDKSTKKGAPLHFYSKPSSTAGPHQLYQIFKYGEPSESSGVQRLLIIVQHSKLFLKAKDNSIVQDQCFNPPPPCFLWTLTSLDLHASSSSSSS